MPIFTHQWAQIRPNFHLLSPCLLLGLCLSAAQALASDWQAMGLMDLGIYYIDVSSIRKISDSPLEMQVWTMLDYRDTQRNSQGQSFRSTRMLIDVNCHERTIKTLSMSWHSGPKMTGSTLATEGVVGPWQAIPPDTALVKIHKSVCAH